MLFDFMSFDNFKKAPSKSMEKNLHFFSDYSLNMNDIPIVIETGVNVLASTSSIFE